VQPTNDPRQRLKKHDYFSCDTVLLIKGKREHRQIQTTTHGSIYRKNVKAGVSVTALFAIASELLVRAYAPFFLVSRNGSFVMVAHKLTAFEGAFKFKRAASDRN